MPDESCYNRYMAKNLFSKLNTLVQANLRDAIQLGRNPATRKASQQDVQRILQTADDRAQQLRADIQALEEQRLRLDEQIDAAVLAGHESQARHLLEQLTHITQQLTMEQSALNHYERTLYDLRAQVNAPDAVSPQTVSQKLASALQQQSDSPPDALANDAPTDQQKIEEDLAQRRARLAK